ncbi:Uncharacterized protein TPAR_08795 [Tolypocladium paradoxum]|uniref:Mesaconyl-C(4)-CoA hydratase n=1 Tax=Tolypocladium paradoxum TaxID=94208 RepID=A0A2S4KLJ0_9HYPO|nr:Uncharacterized protein TPAR_08795 [Tolypocladium paradoxum]
MLANAILHPLSWRQLPTKIGRLANSTADTTRLFSSRVTAADAAQCLMETFSNTSITRRQVLDANQLQKLSLTLGRRELGGNDISEIPPPEGTPIPPGWHLAYFTPGGLESKLGPDGTDRMCNAPEPFSRRMWAGGSMTWLAHAGCDSTNPALRVGDEVEERTQLLSATPKTSRNGDDMVLVDVEKRFSGPRGLSIIDQRSWIFRPKPAPALSQPTRPQAKNDHQRSHITIVSSSGDDVSDTDDRPEGVPSWHLRWSPVGLFRFSALTFNAHMIHYNENWTTNVEGHPGELVHGPLNLINILNYWGDVHGKQALPQHITYRALSPIYAGELYEIKTTSVQNGEERKEWEITAEKNGKICMKANILGTVS